MSINHRVIPSPKSQLRSPVIKHDAFDAASLVEVTGVAGPATAAANDTAFPTLFAAGLATVAGPVSASVLLLVHAALSSPLVWSGVCL
jgi:hypothetical protein